MHQAEKIVAGVLFFVLVSIMLLLIFPLVQWYLPPLAHQEVDSEIVNGILTASSIIFGLQFAFFKPPNRILRLFWVLGIAFEVMMISFSGYYYMVDTMSYGFLTTRSLMSVYLTFGMILAYTMIFAILGLITSSALDRR